jgi:hypothetical protein
MTQTVSLWSTKALANPSIRRSEQFPDLKKKRFEFERQNSKKRGTRQGNTSRRRQKQKQYQEEREARSYTLVLLEDVMVFKKQLVQFYVVADIGNVDVGAFEDDFM